MKRILDQSRSKAITMVILAAGILAFSYQGASAQSQDFFSNTQLTDQRSNGTDGRPGFNPCGNGTVAANGLSCTGATGFHLLSPANISLFTQLGPGAVTDNMFGTVTQPTDPGTCGTEGGNTTTLVNPVFALNCGNVRFDPATQGQTIPTEGVNLTGVKSVNNAMNMVSCSSGTTEVACTGDSTAHSSKLENGFVWNPTTTSQAVPVTLTNMTVNGVAPTQVGCAGTTAAPGVCGMQSETERTSLANGKSQLFEQNVSWSTTVSAAGNMTASPTIRWSSNIVQDDVVGTGGAFSQALEGSFVYNAPPPGVGTSLSFPSVQYPDGESFTNQSMAGANLP